MGSSGTLTKLPVLGTQNRDCEKSSKDEERLENQVIMPVIMMRSSSEENEQDFQTFDNSGDNLVPSNCSRIRKLAKHLQFWHNKPPRVHKWTTCFTNISMEDHVHIEGNSAPEMDITQGGRITGERDELQAETAQNNSGNSNDALQSVTKATASDDPDTGHCNGENQPNVNPYVILDSNIGLSELPAPVNVEASGGSQHEESLSSYIQVDFDSIEDNSQTQLIRSPKQNPFHSNNNFVAMRVEQENFGPIENTKTHSFPTVSDNKATENKCGAAVLHVDKPVERRTDPEQSDDTGAYVAHGNVENPVHENGSCIPDDFHVNSDNLGLCNKNDSFQNVLLDKFLTEGAALPQTDAQTTDTNLATKTETETD
ncbi:hypothetical protein ElyMa_006331700 [Elysia marginata]|uniref:Uncharacterized protein n=1 Tax=Elysia marginata TaxID=1093978 RepID=A0AAV4HHV5_9GAST|nr:hypothetical protein ElyMa_006331700 [Elysia marginata]